MTAKRRRACGRSSAWRICRRGWRPSGCWACCSFICAALPVGWPRGACAGEASAVRLIRGPNGSTSSAPRCGSQRPAIWWRSGVIRAEREKCCDDLVVAASGDAHHYAAALAALEQTRWAANEAVLAATGGSLMKRIHRLLYQPKASALAPVFSAGILMIAAVGAIAAWQAQSPAPPAEPQEKVDRYTRWLNEDVVYIIDGRERAAFLSLKTDAERQHFMEQFWERRNPTPGSPDNAFRNEHYRRIGYAVMHFGWQAVPGWKTDRGRIYIAFGPPDEIEFHPEGQPAGASLEATNAPTEEWLYHSIKGIGSNVIMEFVDTAKTGDFRMTMDPNADKGTFVRRP